MKGQKKTEEVETTAVPRVNADAPHPARVSAAWVECQHELSDVEQIVAEASSALEEASACSDKKDFAMHITEARDALQKALEILETMR